MRGNTRFFGHKHSESARRKVSESLYGNTRTLGKVHSEKTKLRMSSARKGVPKSLKHRARISEAAKKFADVPVNRKCLVARISAARALRRFSGRTKPEIYMREILQSLQVDFFEQAVLPGVYGRWDFYLPSFEILVETDGDYTHCNPHFFKVADSRQKCNLLRDQRKEREASLAGYEVIRFWESEIKSNKEDVILELATYLGKPI